ncbi:hypothetical protein CRG98_038332 [Punica granatum]|uniref:Uncharacterized protein n=1 Tax=Punica granatum TaxID=22663 RepID=A0A2I0IC70_PUNGR|nr:hypothetical protein CRG98_038332 [Punica granatum]
MPLNSLRSDRTGPDRTARRRKPPEKALGRTGEVGLGWAWAGPAKKRTGSRPVSQGRPGSGGAVATASGRRFSPLDAATMAGMGAGDSSGRRRCFAVVDRDLTGF